MVNQDREQWINEALNSTQGMAKAKPGDGLYAHVMDRIGNREDKYLFVPVRQWAVAALLLLALNIGTVVYYTLQNKRAARTASPLATEMQLETTYNY